MITSLKRNIASVYPTYHTDGDCFVLGSTVNISAEKLNKGKVGHCYLCALNYEHFHSRPRCSDEELLFEQK